MGINIQDLGVTDLRVGDDPVLKLYAGDTEVWTRPPAGPKLFEPDLTTGAGLTLVEDTSQSWTEFTPEGFYVTTSSNGLHGAVAYYPTFTPWLAAENVYIKAKVKLPLKSSEVISQSYGMGVGLTLRTNASTIIEAGAGTPAANKWSQSFNISLVFNENRIRVSRDGFSWAVVLDEPYDFDAGVLGGNLASADGFYWWVNLTSNTGTTSLLEVYLSNSDTRPSVPVLSEEIGFDGENIRDYLDSSIAYALGGLAFFISEYGDQEKPMVFEYLRLSISESEPVDPTFTYSAASSNTNGDSIAVTFTGVDTALVGSSTNGWSLADSRGVMPIARVTLSGSTATLIPMFSVFSPAVVSYNGSGNLRDASKGAPIFTSQSVSGAPANVEAEYPLSLDNPIPSLNYTNLFNNLTGLTTTGTVQIDPAGQLRLVSTSTAVSNAVTASGTPTIPNVFTVLFRAKVESFTTTINANTSSLGVRASGAGPFRMMFRVEADGYYGLDLNDNWTRHLAQTNDLNWHNYRIEVVDGFARVYVDGVYKCCWNLQTSAQADQLAMFVQAATGETAECRFEYLYVHAGYPDFSTRGSSLYTLSAGTYVRVHTPALAAQNSNTLVLMWRDELAGKNDVGRIKMRRSIDQGSTWSATTDIKVEDGTWGYSNIVLYKDPLSSYMYAMIGRVAISESEGFTQTPICVRSNDGGVTWSDYALTINYSNFIVTGGHIIRHGNNYLWPFHNRNTAATVFEAGVLISTDLEVWNPSGLVNMGSRFLGEGYLVEDQSDPSKLLYIFRDHYPSFGTGTFLGKTMYSESTDGGLTWSGAVEYPLPNYNVKGVVIKDSAGQLMSVYNSRRNNLYPSGTTDRRTLRLGIKPSANHAWSFDVFADNTDNDQYAALIEIERGVYGVAWRVGDFNIHFTKVDLRT